MKYFFGYIILLLFLISSLAAECKESTSFSKVVYRPLTKFRNDSIVVLETCSFDSKKMLVYGRLKAKDADWEKRFFVINRKTMSVLYMSDADENPYGEILYHYRISATDQIILRDQKNEYASSQMLYYVTPDSCIYLGTFDVILDGKNCTNEILDYPVEDIAIHSKNNAIEFCFSKKVLIVKDDSVVKMPSPIIFELTLMDKRLRLRY